MAKSTVKRNTKQKDAVKSVFKEHHCPLGTPEIHDLVKKKVPGVGIATIYRSVKELLTEKYIVEVELPGEASRYELAGKGHHHHFCCTVCDKVFEIEGCLGVQKLIPAGFSLEGHELTLYGRCKSCN